MQMPIIEGERRNPIRRAINRHTEELKRLVDEYNRGRKTYDRQTLEPLQRSIKRLREKRIILLRLLK